MEKIKLIYIASNGRSGSTLLDLLLGAHPNIWTLGEFQVLPWEIITPRQFCGCGKRVVDCNFWGSILDEWHSIIHEGTIHNFRISHGKGKVLRFDEICHMLFGDTSKISYHIRKYGRENADIIRDVIRQASKQKNIKYVVDASKDPYRLRWLAQSKCFEIYAVHLIKDPRSFVFSMTKNKSFKLSKVIRMNIRYVIENAIISFMKKYLSPGRYVKINYEKMAADPQNTMIKLFDFFGIKTEGYHINNFRSLNHAISGNKMRFEQRGISLDERWRSALPLKHQLLTKLLCMISARRYGYFKSCP